MNKRQLIVQKQFVTNEKAVIRELKHEYSKALAEIEERIKILQASELTQSKIYQLEYQLSLRNQISTILDGMRSGNYDTISKYLNDCYTEAFVGTMFDLQGQGIPLAFPINQSQAIKAVQLDSKISSGLYTRLGFNVQELKKTISSEISRGLSSGLSYSRIAKGLERVAGVDLSKSLNIVRTEGHRIQNQSSLDVMHKAQSCGADIMKQWDATLDGVTRDTHRKLDGQIVEIDEDFTVDGMSAPYPGGFGDPSEDCNCRCCVLQRAKWNLDNFNATKLDNESGKIVQFQEKDYQSFKTAYFQALG